jgi:NAD(P)-dependent dehydrogenase (short-subunit alcohol dehydrogenase family)
LAPQGKIGSQVARIFAREGASIWLQAAAGKTLLKRTPTVPETAEIIAFLASNRASALTGTIVNASCGQVLDR